MRAGEGEENGVGARQSQVLAPGDGGYKVFERVARSASRLHMGTIINLSIGGAWVRVSLLIVGLGGLLPPSCWVRRH